MVGAVLAGEGLERIAEIASTYAGAPVAIVVPQLVRGGGGGESAAAARPDGVTAEVPIVTGGQQLGSRSQPVTLGGGNVLIQASS